MTDYCHCGEEIFVCVGPDKVPLCITHFQEWLRNISLRTAPVTLTMKGKGPG